MNFGLIKTLLLENKHVWSFIERHKNDDDRLVYPPRISIIVPNLNEKEFLRKFLISLANQSFKDFELIIVDGGSTDGSRKVVNRFQLRHPEMRMLKLIDETRNIGYIRNFGSEFAQGYILLHTSSDVMFDPWILERVSEAFEDHELISLTARTKPVSNQILCHLAYQGFDLLRWAFTKMPGSLRKYRPGGNFFAIRRDAFRFVKGFPEVQINEDGLLGQKIDLMLQEMAHNYKVKFDLSMCAHHHVKRFEQRGSIKTILFYLYVFGNMFPFMKPLLYKLEAHSAEVFKNRSDLRDFRK